MTLEANGLTKRYGTRIAVDGLSFTARQGDVVGLLGPNGAGKTTTIRLLTTVLTPTAGEFSVAGVPGSRPAEIRRRVGVLPESAGYPGNQTGREYLRYHARLFGLPRQDADRVATRLLAEMGLDGRAGSRIASYSRGMRQRLGIARALVNDPAVVFLDEPTLGLDPAGQRQVLGIVRDIAQRGGATVVLSTHTLPEVEEVCSSVLILDRGKVVVAGSVGDVTAAAAARRSARLRVPVGRVGEAGNALAGVPGLRVDAVDDDAGVLRVSFNADSDGRRGGAADLNDALRAVLRADVPVLSFEVEGARLSDAFLTMTREGVR
ncbi:MAG TPA: ABC transporter ATP-binding protein [Actinoplanes sp.]|nr:ABC transporter ATP-binding protein [Actinoplanes sp.]